MEAAPIAAPIWASTSVRGCWWSRTLTRLPTMANASQMTQSCERTAQVPLVSRSVSVCLSVSQCPSKGLATTERSRKRSGLSGELARAGRLGERSIGLLPAGLSCPLGIRLDPSSNRPRWMHVAGISKSGVAATHLPTKALQYFLGGDVCVFALAVRRVVENIHKVIRNLYWS